MSVWFGDAYQCIQEGKLLTVVCKYVPKRSSEYSGLIMRNGLYDLNSKGEMLLDFRRQIINNKHFVQTQGFS